MYAAQLLQGEYFASLLNPSPNSGRLSGFQLSVVKKNKIEQTWQITTNVKNLINQSELKNMQSVQSAGKRAAGTKRGKTVTNDKRGKTRATRIQVVLISRLIG